MRTSSGPLTKENAIDDLVRILRECPGGNLREILDAAIEKQNEADRDSVVGALMGWAKKFVAEKQQ